MTLCRVHRKKDDGSVPGGRGEGGGGGGGGGHIRRGLEGMEGALCRFNRHHGSIWRKLCSPAEVHVRQPLCGLCKKLWRKSYVFSFLQQADLLCIPGSPVSRLLSCDIVQKKDGKPKLLQGQP